MSTEMIVKHCAPTLAGIKIANLFSCSYDCLDELLQSVIEKNELLNSRGIYFEILRIKDNTALILVYRKNHLEQRLKNKDVQLFLKKFGYGCFSIESCFHVLKKHLLLDTFPHEIGVFLGYPLQDIKEFIRNKGKNSKCIGCWKVYKNVDEAQKTFEQFKRCKNVYCEKLTQGFEITQLTVAG